MKAQYDLSKMKGRRNPYVGLLKAPITIRIEKATLAYFKSLASEVGLPYQSLINMYLRECASLHRKPRWKSA